MKFKELNYMSKKIVAIGGGLNGRRLDDGNYEPYETGPMDQEQ